LTDKVCIITGAGSGIGRVCARLLAAQQCKVVLVDINAENLENTFDELSAIADPANFLSLTLNICSESDMAFCVPAE
jgi:NADP-dependent 3-hydroxy acid dehydrogenase YdfG